MTIVTLYKISLILRIDMHFTPSFLVRRVIKFYVEKSRNAGRTCSWWLKSKEGKEGVVET
ncbi:hypothetical protein V1478_014760 [Vespula squamosa]|uniref:Uncharacterized protein n=1 Tax=Vespula squamosa TaxID=30214 RepID=A0ABD2A3K8_VESSQ